MIKTLSLTIDSGEEAGVLEGWVSAGKYYADNQGMSAWAPTDSTVGILVGERRGREVIYRHAALLEILTSRSD